MDSTKRGERDPFESARGFRDPNMDEFNDPAVYFAEWLYRRDCGSKMPIEDFAARHPRIAAELLRMFFDWKGIMRRCWARGGGPSESLAVELRARFGGDVDPAKYVSKETRADPDRSEKRPAPADLLRGEANSDRYRGGEEIGHGGMGTVFKVFDEDLRRDLAMKVIRNDRIGLLPRFFEEARITSQLDHPCIVPVHELGIDSQGKAYFTMKLVRGKDLREIFDMVRLGIDGWNLTRAISVLLRVCETMAFAHERNVIHRDLKPGNVMIGLHGEVYVMDWGLARVLANRNGNGARGSDANESVVRSGRHDVHDLMPSENLFSLDGEAVGTPAYMPLEQAEGKQAAVGPRSDVYAVGAMLYHLLSGLPPYHEGDENVDSAVILDRVRAAPPSPIRRGADEAPAELIAICERAMARNPDDRYASMTELGDDLRAYLEHRVVRAYRTGALAEAKLWLARNPLLAWGAVLLAAGVAGFGV